MPIRRSALWVYAAVLFVCPFSVSSQERGFGYDTLFGTICAQIRADQRHTDRTAKAPIIPSDETSDLTIVSHALIRLYQEFISSQQYNVCVFEPSCSHFGQEAIMRCGLVTGVLLTADRLQRCNPFAAHYRYSSDPATGKLLDPVPNYHVSHDIAADTTAGIFPEQ